MADNPMVKVSAGDLPPTQPENADVHPSAGAELMTAIDACRDRGVAFDPDMCPPPSRRPKGWKFDPASIGAPGFQKKSSS